MLSRKRQLTRLAYSVSLSALVLASCSPSASDTSGQGRGGSTVVVAAGRGAAAGRGGLVPGSTAGNASTGFAGNPGFDLGRPMMVPPVMIDPNQVMASGCLQATVLFVVDGSGSMCEVFGTGTRWTSLRGALLAPDLGVVPRLEGMAQFGLMIYDGSIDAAAAGMATMTSPNPACAGLGGFGNMMCPRMYVTQPALLNNMALQRAFPNKEPGGSTPTDKAMNAAVDQMLMHAAGKDPKSNPHIIILATDGQPNDICIGGLGGDGSAQKAGVIAAVDRGIMGGIRTFVISLAGTDAGLEAHLAEVAKHGDPLNPAAHTFSPATPEDLQAALRMVLSSALGCVI